jgi:hypothetical protein
VGEDDHLAHETVFGDPDELVVDREFIAALLLVVSNLGSHTVLIPAIAALTSTFV